MQLFGLLLVLICASVVRCSPRLGARNSVEASIGDHPYVVSLQYLGKHVCGGSILSDQWILTAGHCLSGRHAEDFKVAAGSSSLARPESVYLVSLIRIHEDYDEESMSPWKMNNIGLVRLTDRIHFSNNIKRIPLPIEDLTSYYQSVNFVGWSNNGGSTTANELRKVDLTLESPQHCSQLGLEASNNAFICAEDIGTETIFLCPGDDGGPLVVNGILVGVGLRMDICQAWRIPFTRAWYYKNWIERTIEETSSLPYPSGTTVPTVPTSPTHPLKPLKYRFSISMFINGTIELTKDKAIIDTVNIN